MNKIVSVKSAKDIALNFNPQDGSFEVHTKSKIWKSKTEFECSISVRYEGLDYKLTLNNAKDIKTAEINTGVGFGVKTIYSDWCCNGVDIKASFQTVMWVDNTFGHVHFELIPLCEENVRIIKACWPAPFEFNEKVDTAYTVIPMMQGILIPNNWSKEVKAVEPSVFYERAAYLPWLGQIENGNGYLAVVETAHDAGYTLNHPAGGPTCINIEWNSSLGKFSYNRKIRYSFYENCDYNTLCKEYRKYAKQQGLLVTLDEKKQRGTLLDKLIGSPIIHSGIYSHIKPQSAYNHQDPNSNDVVHTFEERAEQLKRLKSMGVEKAYLHLDGWGKMGYDNMHPDVMPPCQRAGGEKGMKFISDICESLDYIFAIHDQYRDYYTDAASFDEEQAMCDVDGKVHYETIWAGGEQTAICTQLSPYYLKRNFETLKEYGVRLKGTYLDVFAVIKLDECAHLEHKMTRKDCMEKRIECFRYLTSEGLVVSSEEPVEWAVPYLDLVHHAPHAQVTLGEGVEIAIPVPLFNLVYHDCLVIPWSLTKGGWGIPEGQSGYLYALMNAGAPYLNIDADESEIEKIKVISDLHQKIGNVEMLRHEFVEGNYKIQRTFFADGTVINVNLETDEYTITHE